MGLAAGVGEDTRRDATGRTSPLVLVHLVSYGLVEKSPHAFLYLVGERVAFRPEVVGLPEVRATVGADTLAAIQVLVRQGHAVLVHDLGVTRRAVRDPERPPVSSSRTSASAANKATVTPQVLMPVQRLIFTMLLRVSRNLSVERRPSPP